MRNAENAPSQQDSSNLKRKSILKPAGSVSKPEGKVNWGQLYFKLQLPSPDDSNPSSCITLACHLNIASARPAAKPERDKYFTMEIDKREEQKNRAGHAGKPPSLLQLLETLVPAEEAKAKRTAVACSQPTAGDELVSQKQKRSESADDELLMIGSQQSLALSSHPKSQKEREDDVTPQKGKEDDSPMMTPISRSSRFQFVKSPADVARTKSSDPDEATAPAEIIVPTFVKPTPLLALSKDPSPVRDRPRAVLDYMLQRMKMLNTLVDRYKKAETRVATKRTRLNAMIAAGTHCRDEDKAVVMEKTKLAVCRDPRYLSMVNTYLFMTRTLGWRIPTAAPFVHFPYADFLIGPHDDTTLRVKFAKKDFFTGNADTLFSHDARYIGSCILAGSIQKISLVPQSSLAEACKYVPKLARSEYLNSLTEGLAKEMTAEFTLSNRMRTSQLGTILASAAGRLSQLREYFSELAALIRTHVLSDLAVDAGKGAAEYTATVWSAGRGVVVSYRVKASILELWKIVDIVPMYLRTTAGTGGAEQRINEVVRKEFEDTVKENLGLVRPGRMVLHRKFAEFVQKFLTYYETQLLGEGATPA